MNEPIPLFDEHGKLNLFPWQSVWVHAPDKIEWNGEVRPLDVAVLTARGPGKTVGSLVMCWRLARDYPQIPIWYFKYEANSLRDVFRIAEMYFPTCDARVQINKQERFVRFSNGSTIQFKGLNEGGGTGGYAASIQGANIGVAFFEELGSFAEMPDLPLSNLRGPWPNKAVYLSNPYGRLHGQTVDRFLPRADMKQGEIIETPNGRLCAVFGGTYLDNPALGDEYGKAIRAACHGDERKLGAWLNNDWHGSLGGSFFGQVWSQNNFVNWFPLDDWYHKKDWRFWLSFDEGYHSPSWCGLFAEATTRAYGPDDHVYAKDAIVCVAEMSTALPDQRHLGDGSTAYEMADRINDMRRTWYNARGYGFADTSTKKRSGHSDSARALFAEKGIEFIDPTDKDRVNGWRVVRQWMASAKPVGQRWDGGRAFYVNFHHTPQLQWEIQNAMKDPKNPEDLDTRDDGLDSVRYLLMARTRREEEVYIGPLNIR